MEAQDLWMFPADIMTGHELVKFAVEAVDGEVGTVYYATYEVGPGYVAGYIVVDTGPWLSGKKVLLPAGLIDRIDRAEKRIFVSPTRGEIEHAPERTRTVFSDPAHRSELARHYGPGGAGSRKNAHSVGRPGR